jgi:hypothetical protein
MRRHLCLGLACLVLCLAGCSKSPPPVTEAEGVVLLNGQPLPHALVTFVPQLSNFGAEMNSTAISDEQGRFVLQCTYKSQPGAVVGKHRVLVAEGPVPNNLRGMNREAQEGYAAFLKKLKNRPIPKLYAAAGSTDLEVDVQPGGQAIRLELKGP